MRTIVALLDLIIPLAWGASMIALPIGFIIMLFGGGGTVFVNALIVAVITSVLLGLLRSAANKANR